MRLQQYTVLGVTFSPDVQFEQLSTSSSRASAIGLIVTVLGEA
jgi:hypothetical protein